MSQSPFKFLDSYTKDDKDIFFGREREVEELYHRVFEGKILLVYGVSGTGKSSLIHCGLANKFNEADWLPINVRRAGDMVRSMAFAIQQAATTPMDGEVVSPAQFKKAVRSLYLDHYKPVFFIFDQFEELFIFGNKEEKKAFIQTVKVLIESDLQCRFMFILREEYLAGITEFELFIPNILTNRVRVERITMANAKQVIEGPCRVSGIEVEEGFSEEMLEKLSPGSAEVELTYLQVYLDKIYRLATSENKSSIKFQKDLLQQVGNVSDLLGSFLDEQIELLPDHDSTLAVLKSFVSVKGTKRQMSHEQVKEYAQTLGKTISDNALQELFQTLIKLRILRDKDQNGKYELRHDALATKIYEKITLVEKELFEIRHLIENSFNSWQKRGVLMSSEDLEYIVPYKSRLFLPKEYEEFIEKSKYALEKAKKQRRKISLVAMFILFIAFAGFTWWAMLEKSKAIEANELQVKAMITLNENFEKIIDSQTKNKNDFYDQFNEIYNATPFKLENLNTKIQNIRTASEQSIRFINNLKVELIANTENISTDSAYSLNIRQIKNKSEYNAVRNTMFYQPNDSKSNIISLKRTISECKKTIYEQIDKKDWDKISFGLDIEQTRTYNNEDTITWEYSNFNNTDIIGAITNLNNIIKEINYIEINAVEYLNSTIEAYSLKIDRIVANVKPKSNFVIYGSPYEAEVMISAYNSKQNLEAYVYCDKRNLTENDVINTSSAQNFVSKNGIVNILLNPDKLGQNTYAGFIELKTGENEYNRFHFSDSYQVLMPTFSLSALKMNFLYRNIDNIIEVRVPGVSSENLTLSTTNGKIINQNNDIIIFRPGNENISIFSISANIENRMRELGSLSFRVKNPPKAEASIGEKTGGSITFDEIKKAGKISISLPSDFDYDIIFPVSSFKTLTFAKNSQQVEIKSTGASFNKKQIEQISKLANEDYLLIKDIYTFDLEGNSIKVDDIIFKISKP